MVKIPTINLDTNHVSDLAREPSVAASADVIRRLQLGDATLAVSLFNLIELSDPGFKAFDETKALLRDIPHVLANPYQEIVDEEMALACARATGQYRRPPRVWARDTSQWSYNTGPRGSAVDMLDAFRAMGPERQELRDLAQWGANGSMMKKEAALIRQPMLPLELALQRHIDTQRLRFSDYARGLSAKQIIELIGGKSAFPGYQTQESLLAERMKDEGQKSTANDVYDEYIAFYAPYAAVTAVDRRTLHRAKMAGLPAAPRMTRFLSEVPAILDRVVAGELVPSESAGLDS